MTLNLTHLKRLAEAAPELLPLEYANHMHVEFYGTCRRNMTSLIERLESAETVANLAKTLPYGAELDCTEILRNAARAHFDKYGEV